MDTLPNQRITAAKQLDETDRIDSFLSDETNEINEMNETDEVVDKSTPYVYTKHRRGSGVVLGVINKTLCFPEGTLKIIEGPQSPNKAHLRLVGLFQYWAIVSS